MSVVDDYGRYHAHPMLLRSACYPLQIDRVSDDLICEWLNSTQEAGLLKTYEVEGKKFLEITNFKQQIRAKGSKFPDMPSTCTASDTQVQEDDHLDVDEVVDGGGDDITLANARGGSASRIPDCPHQKIIDLYHQKLPENPRIKTWTAQRQANLRQRWRENPSLEEWGEYFSRVARSKFLTGKASTNGSRKPFVASLDWLVKPENFAKVIEGKYE